MCEQSQPKAQEMTAAAAQQISKSHDAAKKLLSKVNYSETFSSHCKNKQAMSLYGATWLVNSEDRSIRIFKIIIMRLVNG